MLILTESQVRPCHVLRKNIFEETVLPGAVYRGKLFFRVASYSQTLEGQAKQAALQLFARHREQLSILIVKAKTQIILLQEDPELQPCSARKAKAQRIQQINLKTLIEKLHGPSGVEIRDRRQGLRRQKYCFVAKEIAEWISRTYSLTDNDGIRLAQRMVDEKVMYHLQHQEKFAANGDYYRFYDDEL
jgi:hypothetical protein